MYARGLTTTMLGELTLKKKPQDAFTNPKQVKSTQ
jgi:hypothetical protein